MALPSRALRCTPGRGAADVVFQQDTLGTGSGALAGGRVGGSFRERMRRGDALASDPGNRGGGVTFQSMRDRGAPRRSPPAGASWKACG